MHNRLAILYEHPRWFAPLFAELAARGVAYEEWKAESLALSPERTQYPDLVLNRMSPSARWRGHGCGQFAALELLRLLERRHVEIVNGAAAYEMEISKFAQLDVFARCGVHAPRTRAANSAKALVRAARDLRFPILLKPNCGGAGSAIVRCDSLSTVESCVGQIDFGADNVVLAQEFHAPRDGVIQRVEVLGGELLYAIRIEASAFNLCPADVCAVTQRRVESYRVDRDIEAAVLTLARAAKLDVGGIEYLIDDATGEPIFYDINALSNFLPNAKDLVGFDPTARFVDYLERRLTAVARVRR